jgi:hypothetical protein
LCCLTATGSSPCRNAGTYITKLPKAEHEAPEWQVAMECLILVAEKNGPTMMARIGVMRALNRHVGAGVQSFAQRHTLGKAEIKTRRMIKPIIVW